jgi:hypothetical protein
MPDGNTIITDHFPQVFANFLGVRDQTRTLLLKARLEAFERQFNDESTSEVDLPTWLVALGPQTWDAFWVHLDDDARALIDGQIYVLFAEAKHYSRNQARDTFVKQFNELLAERGLYVRLYDDGIWWRFIG